MNSRIANILARFNFHKVRKHMILVGWGWGIENKIPTESLLFERAQELLEAVLKDESPYASCSTGGFHAHKWTWDGEEKLELIFALEQEGE